MSTKQVKEMSDADLNAAINELNAKVDAQRAVIKQMVAERLERESTAAARAAIAALAPEQREALKRQLNGA